jgi:hypothetical protein
MKKRTKKQTKISNKIAKRKRMTSKPPKKNPITPYYTLFNSSSVSFTTFKLTS